MHKGQSAYRSTEAHSSPILNNINDKTQSSSTSAEYLERLKRMIQGKMDLVFESVLAQDSDFPTCDSPIWLLGRSFSVHYGTDKDGTNLDELRRRVSTCLWLTYRKNFPSIGDTSLSSDRGWGCMIRAGQMVIAKALLLRHMGPDWHWVAYTRDPKYLKVVSLFADTRTAPLSLHQIAQSGASLGKPVGSWVGPNTVAQALKKLLASESSAMDLQMFIAMDSTLVKSEVKRVCLTSNVPLSFQPGGSVLSPYSFNTPRNDPKWKPLLLIIPLRLGLSDLNTSYVRGIKATFEISQNIGIIGGRPNHALYFIGYAEDEVLFLDPHTCQQAVTVGSKIFDTEKLADESYHVEKPGRMPFAAMDPSIALCFYCRSEEDFDNLCVKLLERFQNVPLPLFEICERRFSDWNICSSSYKVPSTTTATSPNRSSSSSSLSPSQSFTSLGFTKYTMPKASAHHSKSAGSSPASSIGRKSDIDDEEFEILG